MIGAFSGDLHYGLSVEDLDRTPDVHRATEFIVDEAIKRGVDFVSFGGDLADNNTTLPDHIALMISVLNRLEEAQIPTFVTKGNHESISAQGRYWSLTPLEKVGYQNVHFILEPKLIKFEKITFLFLPHATRSQAIEHGFKTAQEFIDARAEELLEKAKEKVTVISHYNINGCKAGTENLMLRQTDLQLPAVVMRHPKVLKIINSHIHTAQEKGKIIMPGSPVCTDFGDLDSPKGFLIGEFDGKAWDFEQVLTPASPMQHIELDLVGANPKEISKTIADAKASVLEDSIVKIRVLINEENLPLVDFEKLRGEFTKGARFVKQVDRIITRKRQIRDPQQKIDLSPVEAVTRYLEFRKPEGMDRKLALAKRFLEGENIKPKESGHEFLSPTAARDALDENLAALADGDEPLMGMGAELADFDFEEDLDAGSQLDL